MLLRIVLAARLAERHEELARHLDAAGLVRRSGPGDDLRDLLREGPVDVLLATPADLGADPVTVLRALRSAPRPPEVVLLTGEPAGALLAAGATIVDAELPPATQLDVVRLVLERASELRRLRAPARGTLVPRTLSALGTTSQAIRRFHEEARRAAASDAPILIRGEPGTGKRLLGPALHGESARARGSFQRFSFAAVEPEAVGAELFGHAPGVASGTARARRGLFERAHGGTLFLENAHRAPAAIQRDLAEAQDRNSIRPLGVDWSVPVDVRLFASVQTRVGSAAGSADLEPDLLSRFGRVDLVVPPLRERIEDLPELAAAVLERCRRRHGEAPAGFSEAALDVLRLHTWPGNLKELESVVERAALLARGDVIQLQDLPVELLAEGADTTHGIHIDAPWRGDSASLPTLREVRSGALEVVDRAYLDRLLRATRGRVGEAARRAGIDPRSLHGLMRRHGLKKEDYKRRPPGA